MGTEIAYDGDKGIAVLIQNTAMLPIEGVMFADTRLDTGKEKAEKYLMYVREGSYSLGYDGASRYKDDMTNEENEWEAFDFEELER